MNKFEKISRKQYNTDFCGQAPTVDYEDIKIPKRATKYSAGYDIYATRDIRLRPGESAKIPTGIRMRIDPDKFLLIVPRSGLGFKYRLQLDNTAGVIDADYYNSDNEGHIWLKITNDSKEAKILEVKMSEAIAQGIILPYYITEDDASDGVRNGGFGSTTKNDNSKEE